MKNTHKHYKYLEKICHQYGLDEILKYPNFFTSDNTLKSFVYFFDDIFSKVSDSNFMQLDRYCNIFYAHLMTMDNIVDHSIIENKKEFFLSLVLKDNSTRILAGLFGQDNMFWDYYNHYYSEYIKAVLKEHALHRNIYSLYSIEEFEKISADKAGLIKIPLAALSVLSENSSVIENFEKSLDSFFIAAQIRDDLKDWRSDLQNKNYTYLISKVIEKKQLADNLESLDADAVGRIIYYTDITDELLDLALQHYDKSLNAVKELSCHKWKTAVKLSISECNSMQKKLNTIKVKEINRIKKKFKQQI